MRRSATPRLGTLGVGARFCVCFGTWVVPYPHKNFASLSLNQKSFTRFILGLVSWSKLKILKLYLRNEINMSSELEKTLKSPSLDEYLEHLETLIQDDQKNNRLMLYRGQDQCYKIMWSDKEIESVYPSIYRTICASKERVAGGNLEAEKFREYLRAYNKGCSFSDPDSVLSILMEMAQKGGNKYPTRLLDVTTNPLVALFNAIDNDNGENGVVYLFEDHIDFMSEIEDESNGYFDSISFHAVKSLYLDTILISKMEELEIRVLNLLYTFCSLNPALINKLPSDSHMTSVVKLLYQASKITSLYMDICDTKWGKYFDQISEISSLIPDKYKNNDSIDFSSFIHDTDKNRGRIDVDKFLHHLDQIQAKSQEVLGSYQVLPVHVDPHSASANYPAPYFINISFYRMCHMVGFPLYIAPNYHQHEQIIGNRMLMQNSKFLLFPNKLFYNKYLST